MECPIARTMAEVGDAWRILIIRDAITGVRRFDDFQASLGIAPNILTTRLASLVADGLLIKRRYQSRPPRFEYAPTDKARDFLPVIIALAAWGLRWLSPDGPTIQFVDRATEDPIDPVLTDRATGRVLTASMLTLQPGPSAGPEILARVDRIRRRANNRPATRPPADR